MKLPDTRPLVETDWLEAHLAEPDLRVLDCTVQFSVDESGARLAAGRDVWARGHVPGAAFADLMGDLSDAGNPLPFMMPPPERFAEAMGRLGVGDGTTVVLYDSAADAWANMWATRVWWMLRSVGFDEAAVLNGGFHKWKLEKRPVSTEPPPERSARLVPRPRPGLFAGKREVAAAIGAPDVRLVNALTFEEHAGRTARYGRPGHIPSSVCVPTVTLVDPVTHAYLPAKELRARLAEWGALDRERVITYCGGGIAATSDAMVLTMLGVRDVAVYDGSLLEWATDPATPMEV